MGIYKHVKMDIDKDTSSKDVSFSLTTLFSGIFNIAVDCLEE